MADVVGAAAARGKDADKIAAGEKQNVEPLSGLLLQKVDWPEILKPRSELRPPDWLPPPLVRVDEINHQAMEQVKRKNEDIKPELLDTAARDQIISQLGAGDRKQLDALRLKLSVASGEKEREERSAEISGFLKSKLAEKVTEKGLAAILSPQKTSELIKEIKSARPDEVKELLAGARAELVADARQTINEVDKQKSFEEQLAAFDKRATARGLSEAELLGTYLQTDRVLNPKLKLEHGDKSLLARSIMANAADPSSIDQGGHMTCNVTTLECRLFAQEPAIAARVIADLAVAGKFVTADGTVIRPLNLDPDAEAQQDPTPDGARNYASQLFQLVAINAYWNRCDTMPGGKTVGKGNIMFAQTAEGECLLDISTNPPQRVKFDTIDAGQPWLDIHRISEINEQLSGKPSHNLGIRRWIYSFESSGVSKIATLHGFKEKLSELKKENAFPVIIEVDAAKKPFGDGKGYGPHVVTVTDYDPQTGLVTIDNQWGKGADLTDLPGQGKRPSAEVVFSSMNPIPPFDFFWDKIKSGLHDVKLSDSVKPTIAAVSTKGLGWGLSAAAPLAVRGGLSCLSEWGVPGAAGLLSASETRLGGATLRVGTSLAALGAYAYINDLPGAFQQGASHGFGKLTRVGGDWASFELGRTVTSKIVSFVPCAPLRIGVSVAAGMASATVFDRLLGEGSEVGGSWVYDRARELWSPRGQLAAPEQAVKREPPPPNPTARDGGVAELGKPNLTAVFSKRYAQPFAPTPPSDIGFLMQRLK